MNNLNHNRSGACESRYQSGDTVGCVTRYAQVEPESNQGPWVTSYPPYESTGQTNTNPTAVNNFHPPHESTDQTNTNPTAVNNFHPPHGDADELI